MVPEHEGHGSCGELKGQWKSFPVGRGSGRWNSSWAREGALLAGKRALVDLPIASCQPTESGHNGCGFGLDDAVEEGSLRIRQRRDWRDCATRYRLIGNGEVAGAGAGCDDRAGQRELAIGVRSGGLSEDRSEERRVG